MPTTCPTCRQRIATDRALPHANDTDDGAANLWASYILGLLAKYPGSFCALVVSKAAMALADKEGGV
tara:strand:- start:435 stop:635 length:201 start_codon:yes stop_codon:yes gene_type:complete